MVPKASFFISVLAIASIAGPASTAAQSGMTNEQKIAQAMAAGPSSISANATIMDWPDASGKQAMLRKGNNGWMCMPSHPSSQYLKNDSMCLDKPWQDFIGALVNGKKPHIHNVGYAYMLTSDGDEANTKMGEMAPTKTNMWHHVGPHVMVVYPNANTARMASNDPHSGGPYVMWKNTPYAHIMWPVPK